MIKDKIKEQLRRDEGEVLYAYQDSLGYWTIGVGHLIDRRKGGGISKKISDLLLEDDIISKMAELDVKIPWWRKLDDARQGALLNMAFQLGVNGLLQFKTSLALIQDGKYEDAYYQLLRSLWAQQTPARANRVAAQIRDGEWK